MKTFQEFVLECFDLQEKSLSRIVSKTQKGGIAIISPDRGDKTNKENQKASSRLTSRIRGAGLPGPTQVQGAYRETGTTEDQREKSFVVPSGKMGKKKFKKVASKLGQEGGLKQKRNQKSNSKNDDQDCVLIKQKTRRKISSILVRNF
jgi:hypothetical protein